MALAVIGVGLCRTGTWSLKLALERLGFGPCYHMSEVFPREHHWPLWEAAAKGEAVDWEELFAEHNSTTDAPACFFWRELMELYPKAKLVLSLRDPERWFDSTQATVLSPPLWDRLADSPIGGMMKALLADRVDGRIHDRGALLELYHRHNQEVSEGVPPDRLLTYRVREGWGPLCRFLGVPAPDEPFPHVNSREQFLSRHEPTEPDPLQRLTQGIGPA